MSKIIAVIPHYNTCMWTQTSTYCLINAAKESIHDVEIVVIDNASDSGRRSFKSNTINSIATKDFSNITVLKNDRPIKFQGTALDMVVQYYDADYLLCWESDIAIFDNKIQINYIIYSN